MNARVGEPKQDTYNSGTYDSITLNSVMFHKTANTAFASTDFKPEQVNVKVNLRRGGNTYTIMNDNLLILGVYNSLMNGLHFFLTGADRVYPASGVYAHKQRSVTLYFGGSIRIGDNDTLHVEVNPSSTCMNATNVDTANSYIEFYANPSIGYELGIFSTKSEVVQANTTNQPFSPGNNVTKIGFLNFDKNDLSTPVINTLQISSDRWDCQMTFQKILAYQARCYPNAAPYRFGATPPTQSVFRFSDTLPQSVILFDGEFEQQELDKCRLDVTFNGADVTVSNNYMVWTTYESSKEQLADAMKRAEKHTKEKLQSLPAITS